MISLIEKEEEASEWFKVDGPTFTYTHLSSLMMNNLLLLLLILLLLLFGFRSRCYYPWHRSWIVSFCLDS